MQAGELDQIIAIQSLTETNVSGSLSKSWATVATVWGKVISKHGSEAFEAARINAKSTIRVKVRYRSDLQSDWRILWDSQYYNIVHIDQSERRKGYTWFTAEVTGAI